MGKELREKCPYSFNIFNIANLETNFLNLVKLGFEYANFPQ